MKYKVGIITIIVIWVLLSLPYISQEQIGDGAEYMQSAVELDALLQNGCLTIGDLAYCRHMSYGYALWNMLFLIIPISEEIAIIISQLALGAISIVACGTLASRLFSNGSTVEKLLMVSVYAFSPYVLGMNANFTLDYGLMASGVIFLALFVDEKHHILGFISGLLFAFTKEPAIVAYVGMILGSFIVEIIWMKDRHNTKNIICWMKKQWMFITPAVIWFIVYVNHEKWSASGTEFNTFAFSKLHFFTILKQLCTLQFNWVFVLMIVIGTFKTIKKGIQLNAHIMLLGIVEIVYLVFQGLYLTHTHARYMGFAIILLYLIAGYFLNVLSIRKRIGVLAIIVMLLLVQNYHNIDFVTSVFYPQMTCSGERIYSLQMNGYLDAENYVDSFIYNRQYIKALY